MAARTRCENFISAVALATGWNRSHRDYWSRQRAVRVRYDSIYRSKNTQRSELGRWRTISSHAPETSTTLQFRRIIFSQTSHARRLPLSLRCRDRPPSTQRSTDRGDIPIYIDRASRQSIVIIARLSSWRIRSILSDTQSWNYRLDWVVRIAVSNVTKLQLLLISIVRSCLDIRT